MKQILFFAFISILATSCASLYTPSQEPITFLEKQDGIALTGGLSHNGSTAIVAAGATKAIQKNVSLNVNGHLGLLPKYYAPGNPFANSKKNNSINVNLGWNSRGLTVYPIQFWLGLQLGNATDSYDLNRYFYTKLTNDLQYGSTDSILFEKAVTTYAGTRLGITFCIISNYGNEFERKQKKKVKFDIINSAHLSPTKFKFKNSDSFATQTNFFVGNNLGMRVYSKNWMVSGNMNFITGGKNIIDDLGNRPSIPTSEMRRFAQVFPSITFTYLLK